MDLIRYASRREWDSPERRGIPSAIIRHSWSFEFIRTSAKPRGLASLLGVIGRCISMERSGVSVDLRFAMSITEKAPCMLCLGESKEVRQDANPWSLFTPASGLDVNIVFVIQS